MDSAPVYAIDDQRGAFANSFDFIATCLSFVVGLTGMFAQVNVFGFFGGGWIRLVIVAIVAFLLAFPYIHLELSLGQVSGLGPSGTFAKMAPIFRGVGWTWGWLSLIRALITSLLAAHCLFYFIASLRASLDWVSCGHWWNDERCVDYAKLHECRQQLNVSSVQLNINGSCITKLDSENWTELAQGAVEESLPSAQFFMYYILGIDSNQTGVSEWMPQILDISWPQWHISLAMLLVWAIVFACLIGGARIYGKIALVVFLLLPTILLVVMLSLLCTVGKVDIFGNTTWKLLKPDFSKQGMVQTELRDLGSALKFTGDVLREVFWMFGCGFGVFTTLSSFHKPSSPRRIWPVALINPILIILFGLIFTFFTTIFDLAINAFLKDITNLETADNFGGMQTLFYYMPQAMNSLELGPLWAALYYFMSFLFCMGHLIPYVWTGLVCITDEFPRLYAPKCTALVLLLITLVLLVSALVLCTPVGYSILVLIIHILPSALYPTVLIVLFVVVLAYGWYELQKDLSLILGVPSNWRCFTRFWGPTSSYDAIACFGLLPAWVLALDFDKQWHEINLPEDHFEQKLLPYPWTWFSWSLIGIIPLLLILGIGLGQMIYTKCIAHKPCSALVSTTSRWPTNGTTYLVATQTYTYVPPAGNGRVCWCCCNYRTGAIVIFIIETIIYALGLIGLINYIFFTPKTATVEEKWVTVGINIFFLFIGYLVLGASFRAVRSASASCLIPFLFVQMILTALTPLLLVFFAFYKENHLEFKRHGWIWKDGERKKFSASDAEAAFDISAVAAVGLLWLFRAWILAIVAGAHWKFRTEKPVPMIPHDKSDVPLVMTAPTALPEDDEQDKETSALVGY